MKQNKQNFYVVFASDGVYIHPQYERALYYRDHYFSGSKTVVKCKTKEEALVRAREHLTLCAHSKRLVPQELQVDHLYRIDTRKEN